MQVLARRRHPVLFFSLALALGLGACGGGAGTAGAGGRGGVRRNSNRIEAAELATVAEADAYTAISRLRPAWLRGGTSGSPPEIIVDGSPQSGGPDVLRNFRAADVMLLEYMSASDATTRYGTGYDSGAIIVTTRR